MGKHDNHRLQIERIQKKRALHLYLGMGIENSFVFQVAHGQKDRRVQVIAWLS